MVQMEQEGVGVQNGGEIGQVGWLGAVWGKNWGAVVQVDLGGL